MQTIPIKFNNKLNIIVTKKDNNYSIANQIIIYNIDSVQYEQRDILLEID